MDSDNLISRFKALLGIEKDAEIASLLGMKPTDFSNRKKSGTIITYLFQYAVHNKMNLDGLFYGGDQYSTLSSPEVAFGEEIEEHNLYKLLKKASEVLESEGIYKTALASNINAFHHSIKIAEDLERMKARMDSIETSDQQTKNKIDELAQQIKDLKEENRALKETRSSEESTTIIDASSQATQPSSRKTT